MTVWNIGLRRRHRPIVVKKVLRKEPEFMVILDSRGKQHELSEIDFPSFDWKKIGAGATITLALSEVVKTWRVQSSKVEKNIRQLILEVQKKVSGLFFIWVCEQCGTAGYVEYEDGDDPQGIAVRVLLAHKEKMSKSQPECWQKVIRIFDHRGMEQKDSKLLLSSYRL